VRITLFIQDMILYYSKFSLQLLVTSEEEWNFKLFKEIGLFIAGASYEDESNSQQLNKSYKTPKDSPAKFRNECLNKQKNQRIYLISV